MLRLCAILLILAASGCGKETDFEQAKASEKLGRYATAITHYENAVQQNPKQANSAEALFNIGEIYRTVIKDYPRARTYFERVIKEYPDQTWSQKAEESLMNCPDYFPLDTVQNKVMGDSSSGGEHMHTLEKIEPVKDAGKRYKWLKQIFAGEQVVGSEYRFYEKKDRELREYRANDPQYSIVMRYPPVKGLSWETLSLGKRVTYLVEDDKATIEIHAGIFTGCLKVREQYVGMPSTWKYNYYAPWTGLALTCVATEKNETRIVELLSSAPTRSNVPGKTKKANRFYLSVDKIKAWFAEIKDKIKKR